MQWGLDPFKQQRGPFNSQHGQSLPPSFADSSSSSGGGWSAEGFIRYELEASLKASTKISSPGDLSSTQKLDFVTFRSIQSPDPQPMVKTQTVACYSMRLRQGDEGLPLTFKEKFKSMRTSNLPVAMFKIHMELPRVGVAGQPLPTFLKLDHDTERSTAPVVPVVLLKKCSLNLQVCTFIQCMRNDMSNKSDEHHYWDTEPQIAFVDFTDKMETAPALSKHFDLRDIMRVRVPPYQRPTFSTFNIRRTYRLRLKLSVVCAQKTFKAEFLSDDFVLLAKDYMPNAEGNPETSSSNAALDVQIAPIYQEALGPPPPEYDNAKMP